MALLHEVAEPLALPWPILDPLERDVDGRHAEFARCMGGPVGRVHQLARHRDQVEHGVGGAANGGAGGDRVLEGRGRGAAAADPRVRLAGAYGAAEVDEVFASMDVLVVPSVWLTWSPASAK